MPQVDAAVIAVQPLADGRHLRLRAIADEDERPEIGSEFEDWGDRDPRARPVDLMRWLVEAGDGSGDWLPVGDMSAHAVWYGASTGSRAMNIGVGLVASARGLGIGWRVQRALAEHLHAMGVVRVEASTDVINIAERHSLARAGFVPEGTLRMAQARRDGLHDLQVWAHISPEA